MPPGHQHVQLGCIQLQPWCGLLHCRCTSAWAAAPMPCPEQPPECITRWAACLQAFVALVICVGLPNNMHSLNAGYLLSTKDNVWWWSVGLLLQAWRAPHPPARGNLWLGTKPLVHVGFLKSWVAGGLNQRVVGRVSELVRAASAAGTACRIYVTGVCAGLPWGAALVGDHA